MTREEIKLVQEVAEVLSVPYKVRAYAKNAGLGFTFGVEGDTTMIDNYGEAMLSVVAADTKSRANKPPVG